MRQYVRVFARRAFLAAFVLAVTGCSSAVSESSPAHDSEDAGEVGEVLSAEQGEVVSTTTVPAQPPRIDAPTSTFAQVNQAVSEAIVVSDPNGEDSVVRILSSDAPGLVPITNVRGRIIGFDWEPDEPGEWDVTFTATDPGGLTSEETVRLIARNEPSIDMMFVMGDSIAAGFGRDRSDFVGADECFRSEGDSYGSFAFERLIDAGALGSDASLLFVACAGTRAADLASAPTIATDQDGTVVGEPATQLARATELNPTIITLTVGAADVGLFDVDQWLESGADQQAGQAVDLDALEAAVARVRTDLEATLEVLVQTTSAHIVLTTMYNPVAGTPIGVEGCSGACMVAASTTVLDQLNAMIIELVENQREGRVSLARLDGEADVWEAPNGAGIDALRDGLGPLQGLVETFTGASNAFCADDAGVDQTLISRLDCAHPNEAGQRAIAEVVISELLAI